MRIFHGTRFFLKLTVICLIAVFLTLNPGQFTVEWFDYKSTMPVSVLLAALFLLVSLLLLFHHCWRWFENIPMRTKGFFHQRRIRKFEDVVIEGLTAIAAQQPEEAQSYADLARGLAPTHPLALFLTGQTSYLTKDHGLAQSTFSKMAEQSALRFLGLRGLVLLAIERHDWLHAQSYLEELFNIRPDSPWVLKQLENNSLKLALSDSTNKAVDMLPFYRHLPKEDALKHQGLMLWIKLKHNIHSKLDELQQFELLKLTYEMLPKNPVVVSDYACVIHTNQQKQKAVRLIHRTYKQAPHRLLAETLLYIHNVSDPLERYRKVEKLTAHYPHHEESYWLMAKAALEADLWGQARHHIQPLLHDVPTKSTYQLMIEIEDREHPDQPSKAEFWRTKLAEVHHEWEWICHTCNHVAPTWDAYCSVCGHFGGIEWCKVSNVSPAPLSAMAAIQHSRII
jgi:HemY protein